MLNDSKVEVVRNDNDWIQTYTGRKFWAFEPSVFDVCIQDIAHALAMKCRYAGHCNQFYSVAQHSVYMACEIAARNWDKPFDEWSSLAMWALLHDATEAYLPDVPRPQKHRLEVNCVAESATGRVSFAYSEDKLMTTIALALELKGVQIPKEIKHLDSCMLNTERQQLFDDPIEWGSMKDYPPITNFKIDPWQPEKAKHNFMLCYMTACGKRSKRNFNKSIVDMLASQDD